MLNFCSSCSFLSPNCKVNDWFCNEIPGGFYFLQILAKRGEYELREGDALWAFIRCERLIFQERCKVINPKYYKHLKKGGHQQYWSPKPFGQTKNGLVSGRLACTSSKTEIFNKVAT